MASEKKRSKPSRVQPLRPVKLTEEEKQLRALGMQFKRIVRQVEGLEKVTIPTLKDELVRLGLQIQGLQRQAEVKRVERQIEKGERKSQK